MELHMLLEASQPSPSAICSCMSWEMPGFEYV